MQAVIHLYTKHIQRCFPLLSRNGKTQALPPVVEHSWFAGAAVVVGFGVDGLKVVGLTVVVCTFVVVVVCTIVVVGASVGGGVGAGGVGGGCVIGLGAGGGGCVIGLGAGGAVIGGASVGLVPGKTVVVGWHPSVV